VGQASGNELKQKKFLNVENGSDSGSTAANCPLMSCSLVGYAKKRKVEGQQKRKRERRNSLEKAKKNGKPTTAQESIKLSPPFSNPI